MQIYEPKRQGVAGGREMGGSREREKESCRFSKDTATNLAAETPRYGRALAAALPGLCGAATITIGFSD